MSENEEIVENTKATMDMEGLPLPDDSERCEAFTHETAACQAAVL